MRIEHVTTDRAPILVCRERVNAGSPCVFRHGATDTKDQVRLGVQVELRGPAFPVPDVEHVDGSAEDASFPQ